MPALPLRALTTRDFIKRLAKSITITFRHPSVNLLESDQMPINKQREHRAQPGLRSGDYIQTTPMAATSYQKPHAALG